MAISLSDFASKVAAAAPLSGAGFRVTTNPDGSLTIWRTANATAGVAGGPSSPWTVLYARVIYNQDKDSVVVGDGSGVESSTSAAFVAALA